MNKMRVLPCNEIAGADLDPRHIPTRPGMLPLAPASFPRVVSLNTRPVPHAELTLGQRESQVAQQVRSRCVLGA
jgi:hypothetical protein